MTHRPDQTLRIIDANLDRATEGLRVLEDVARFVLDYAQLAMRLKELRHRLHDAFPEFIAQLISARDSAGDVGRAPEGGKDPAADLIGTVVTNARRVEQSLRVLEELSRLPDAIVAVTVFEEARFAVYDIEKELVSKLSRRDKIARLAEPYIIIETEDDLALALKRRAGTVQLNQSRSTRRDFWDMAHEFRNRCDESHTQLIIREHIDIALAVKADGVVIDVDSLPVSVIRGLLKIDQLIGFAARSCEEGMGAQVGGVDYLIAPERGRRRLIELAGIPVVIPAREENQ